MRSKMAEQLMAELSRRNIDLVASWALGQTGAISCLVEITLSQEEKVSSRSSWVLEKLSDQFPGILDEYIPEIITAISTIESSSIRRTLAKVLMLHKIPESLEGQTLDFCLKMIERVKEPVAVKANCMTVLFNLLPKYPELKNEVFAIIETQIPYNSVGFKSRFEVLKKRIAKE
ncbi:MAG: hypothetical protein WCX31_16030 [Salinivirgaceae bacterium]